MGIRISSLNKKKKTNSSITVKKKYNFDESSSTSMGTDSRLTSDSSAFTNGRTFHHVQNSAYWFPNDDEEMDRLIGQHFAIKSLFGGNILVPDVVKKENQIILDLGCGPGTWLMDVATEYPFNQFIGVDMCDVFPNNIRPPNVTFQLGNALERLPFADNTFDLVNIRLFIIALKKFEWPIVIQEAYRILKPGGYLQIIECGMLERGNEFVKHAGKIFKEVIENRGQEPYIAYKLKSLLESQSFKIRHYENKDVYLGRPDALSREFLWDACSIFKTAQLVLQEPLGCTQDSYPHFLDRLYKEFQKQPDAMWSFSICIGQK